MGNLVYLKHSYIIATNTLELIEQRVIYSILSRIDQRKEVLSTEYYSISFQDFKKDYPMKDNSSWLRDLEKATKNILSKTFHKTVGKISYGSVLVQSYIIDREEGVIKLKFADGFIPYISDFQNNFLAVKFNQFKRLDSQYAVILYEVCLQYSFKKSKKFKLYTEEIIEIFSLPKSCKEMRMFKAKVLKPAILELRAQNIASITVDDIKIGKKIVGFSFNFYFIWNREKEAARLVDGMDIEEETTLGRG